MKDLAKSHAKFYFQGILFEFNFGVKDFSKTSATSCLVEFKNKCLSSITQINSKTSALPHTQCKKKKKA